MLRLATDLRVAERRGPLLMAVGVSWVLLAQIFQSLPVASAIAMVGYGATMVVATGTLRSLALPNCFVYGLLGSLAIAAQWEAAIKSAAGRVGPALAADHVAAAALLMLLAWHTARIAFREPPTGS